MRFSAAGALAATFALLSCAQAIDLRELYTFPGGNGLTFCKAWKCACINYTPSDSTLSFQAAYCHPGDYQGKNNNTEALAYCSFTAGTAPVAFSDTIASELGATPTTS
ncbi:hypothetical protein PUNSTDRAFT_127252 [Punctularia strigosozonata HHB-11173 SS5]|uniref:uncharacterized protein n=1 Tax=Punctularia strigosozonata (strain HHB-11173) TaxID=741275 RepID=UPI0004417C59|nr:uncharacterized protein PUNSTDRAFT_127252 [Punctularia strigosozonata HHB-11173 SS5]EIN06482.1 hypothetical protein PUNSTDRAFT_127252 [Punctularia strigosozonata HHB-11173 SS5]